MPFMMPSTLPPQISDAITGNNTRAFLSDGKTDCLFNVVTEKSEQDSNEISSHAIENGSEISDHVVQRPKTINLNIVLSDDTVDNLNPMSYAAVFIDTIDDREQTLQGWLDKKTMLTYHGHSQDVENVVIESLTRSNTKEMGSGLGLSMTLKRLTIATSQTVNIKFKSVTEKGKSATKKAEKSGQKQKSILKSMKG